MTPAAYIRLDAMPLTANGKLDYEALSRISDGSSESDANTSVSKTPTEDVLISIWAQLLGRDHIGPLDSFFAIGGHSLLAAQVVSRIRDVFLIDFPLRKFFDEPTVMAAARLIDDLKRKEGGFCYSPIRSVDRNGKLPLSFAQQRLWFLQQLHPDDPAYNIPAAVRLSGSLDTAALRRTMNEIVKRHEILRTSFPSIEGRPFQLISPAYSIDFPTIDLSEVEEAEREVEALRLIHRDAEAPFNLEKSPLWRIALLSLKEEEHILLLTMHHTITDAWSLGVLVREIGTHYEAFSQGRSPSMPDLPIQYADFAQWQKEWLQGEGAQRQLAYWKRQLGGISELNLHRDRPREFLEAKFGRMQTYYLDGTLSGAIKELSRREGVTLFMCLFAALQIVLRYQTRQDQIVVGTDIAGRGQIETEALIGLFINQVVLRTDLSGEPSFQELLGRVRRTAIDAYINQDLPFDKVVDELKPERRLGRNPIFQVLFGLRNAPIPPLRLSGLVVTPLQINNRTTPFDLGLYVSDTPQGLSCLFRYDTRLIDPPAISRCFNQFVSILEMAVAEPQTRMKDFDESLAEADRLEQLEREREAEASSRLLLQAIRRKPITRAS